MARPRRKFVPPTPEEIHRRMLEGFQTEPFGEALARFLGAEPDAEHLRAWAQKNPDRWAQAVAGLARLSGMEHAQDAAVRIGTLNVLAVSKMADSELIAGLQRLLREAGHDVGLLGGGGAGAGDRGDGGGGPVVVVADSDDRSRPPPGGR